jgi:hypothetical protein
MFGDRRVAVALDDVHGDAVLGQLVRMHVAARPGAEKDDVLQTGAVPHDFGRQLAVVVEHEIVAGKQSGQRIGRHLELFVYCHRRVIRAHHAMEHLRQIVHGIEKQALHHIPQQCAPLDGDCFVARRLATTGFRDTPPIPYQ